jgi:hypothetical protein
MKFLNFIKGALDITVVTVENIHIEIKHYEPRVSNTEIGHIWNE